MDRDFKYTDRQLEVFINGYTQALLFATNDEHGEPLDANFTGGDIEECSFSEIKSDCIEFLFCAGDTIDEFLLERVGMDFFYTRNGHGSGFYDRHLPPKLQDRWTRVAKSFPESNIWIEKGEVHHD